MSTKKAPRPSAASFTFAPGEFLRDSVTGFKGHVIGRADYLTGCNQYAIQPQCTAADPSKVPELRWVDEIRLVRDAGSPAVELPDPERALDDPGADAPPSASTTTNARR